MLCLRSYRKQRVRNWLSKNTRTVTDDAELKAWIAFCYIGIVCFNFYFHH